MNFFFASIPLLSTVVFGVLGERRVHEAVASAQWKIVSSASTPHPSLAEGGNRLPISSDYTLYSIALVEFLIALGFRHKN